MRCLSRAAGDPGSQRPAKSQSRSREALRARLSGGWVLDHLKTGPGAFLLQLTVRARELQTGLGTLSVWIRSRKGWVRFNRELAAFAFPSAIYAPTLHLGWGQNESVKGPRILPGPDRTF